MLTLASSIGCSTYKIPNEQCIDLVRATLTSAPFPAMDGEHPKLGFDASGSARCLHSLSRYMLRFSRTLGNNAYLI